jgi:AraC-like DNA-binding protein
MEAPVGKYLAGRFWLHWIYSPTLIGSVYFGRTEEADFPLLEPLFALPGHSSLQAPYDVLVDGSALESLPPSAFEFLSRYLAVAGGFASRMRRVAIVRPPGHAGIVLAGVFYELVTGVFEAALFADREEAARWLDHPQSPDANRELDEIVGALRGTSPQLRRLQAWLMAKMGRPSIQEAATELGISSRSLQRLLAAANTSFRRELEHARLRAAEALLIDSQSKLEAVAREVGYSTLSHFTVAFRRATGETPSDFRKRRQH